MRVLETRIVKDEPGNDCWIREVHFTIEDNDKTYVLAHRTEEGSWFKPTDEWYEVKYEE